jgi:hypothetical protein
VALLSESAPGQAECYAVDINENEFAEINRELGVFRFVLTDRGES